MSISSPDVAILAANNEGVRAQQLRVGQKCLDRGMSVEFILEGLHCDAMSVASRYQLEGTTIRLLHSRTWRRGPFAYPAAPAQLRLLRSLGSSLRDYRPRVLMTHSDAAGVWRVMQAWAKRQGVIGVVLQEGVCARRRCPNIRWPGSQVRRTAGRLLRRVASNVLSLDRRIYEYADHALVWGEAMRQALVDRGMDPQTVHVVGNPGFDHIPGRRALAPASRRTVLFAQQPQPDRDTEREACQKIIAICADRLRCRLLFRPHPRGGPTADVIRSWATATTHPELVTVADTGEMSKWIDRASVFLTYYSTSSYSAALGGLPIVLADWISSAYELDAPAFGAALAARSTSELETYLGSALDDAKVRVGLYDGATRWLDHHIGRLDGEAAGRASRVLQQLSVEDKH